MNSYKWIKLYTNLFDNRKIKQIESMPEGDALLVIWLKLLVLAANTNDGGLVYFTHDLPYTDQMLATEFNKPLTTIQLALDIFIKFEMINIVDDIFQISNWEKYQCLDYEEKIKEQNRLRKQKQRERQKQIECHVTVTEESRNVTEENKNKNKNKNNILNKEIYKEKKCDTPSDILVEKVEDFDIDNSIDKKDNIPYIEILDYLNVKTNRLTHGYRNTHSNRRLIKARFNEGYTKEDFIVVINNMCDRWLNDPKYCEYLQPSTLFGNKFESYLNKPKLKNTSEDNVKYNPNVNKPISKEELDALKEFRNNED